MCSITAALSALFINSLKSDAIADNSPERYRGSQLYSATPLTKVPPPTREAKLLVWDSRWYLSDYLSTYPNVLNIIKTIS